MSKKKSILLFMKSSSIGLAQSVAGVIFTADRTSVLLIKRRDVPVWVLPGGGIDPKETAENAILREIFEETGLTVKIDRVVGIYTPINRLTRTTKLFECSCVKGSLTLSNETKEISFFSMSKLPPLPPPFLDWIYDAKDAGLPILKPLTNVTYKALAWNFIKHPILVIRFILARIGLTINT